MEKIDKLDKQILEIISQNARIPFNGGYDQKDTGKEPAGGGFRSVGVSAGKFAIGLDTAYQTKHRTDGIA